MDKTKKDFFDIMSEYMEYATDTFNVYKFDKKDIEGMKWFLEMLWSISKIYDIRFLLEDDYTKIILKTDDAHWRLF